MFKDEMPEVVAWLVYRAHNRGQAHKDQNDLETFMAGWGYVWENSRFIHCMAKRR